MASVLDLAPREVARLYLQRGWAPIPLPYGSKQPVLKAWQALRPTEADLPGLFPGGPQNVGVLLGDPSSGLVDVDLDAPEVHALADRFLPTTRATFGRPSSPRAHRLYLTPDLGRTVRWRDSTTLRDDARASLLELRATGAQTLFPPRSTRAANRSPGTPPDRPLPCRLPN